MSGVFRLGLVGGGRMGRTHLRALGGSSAVQCVAVAEPYESSAQELRDMGLAVYPNVDELLAAGSVDGVLICAPTDQHADLAKKIIEAGIPVLCEKPFGLSAQGARKVAALAAERGVALQIGYWRRFIPALVALRRDIAAGVLGNVHLLVCSQWDEMPPPAGFRNHSGGIYVDMGVHEIDEALWLLGSEVAELFSRAFPGTEDPVAVNDVDSAQALLTLADGSTVVITLGRFYPGGDIVTAEVFGSRGHSRIEVVSPATGEAPQLEALRLQAESFARHAAGGVIEGATALEAASVLEIAESLMAAAGISVLGQPSGSS